VKKIIAALLTLTIAATPVACTAAKNAGTTAENVAIQCAKQDLGQTWLAAGESVLMFIIATIANGGTNWQSDLDAAAAKYGPDLVACAAQVAAQVFNGLGADTGSGAGSGSGSGSAAPVTADIVNGPEQRALAAVAKYAAGRKFQ
jgi:hypothetical protein